MSDPTHPRLPESFEGFRVGSLRRAAGALGVYAATDRLDLRVELHAIRADALPATFPPDRFLAALRSAADVRHEALLTYVTGGRAGDLLFAVAKCADAPGLDEVLARGGGLAEDRAIAIGAALCGVLATLENAKLRHGDITAKRVCLPGRGAVLVGPPRLVPATSAPRNERYQSPEEAAQDPGDARSDQFTIGLVVAEALRGESVLRGPAAASVRMLVEGTYPADGGVSEVSPALRSILLRLLAKNPRQRFADAASAVRAFEAVRAGRAPDLGRVPSTDQAPVEIAIPLGDAPPETAPIDLSVRVNPAQAPAISGAPVATARPAGPLSPSAGAAEPEGIRRTPGRLYLNGRLGETMLEIDESVYVGKPADAADLVARTDPFPEAEYRVERQVENDLLFSIPGRRAAKVNGEPAAGRPLAAGDRIEAGEASARYEREARRALQAAPSGPPVGQAKANTVMAAAAVIAVVGLAFAWLRVKGPLAEGAAATDAKRSAETELARARASSGSEGGGAPDPAEKAAQTAYEDARAWMRSHPGETAAALDRFRAAAEGHRGTGHGALAEGEAADLAKRLRAGGGTEVESAAAKAIKDAEAGKVSAALDSMAQLAAKHAGTMAGERAQLVAAQIEAAALGRLETDLAKAEGFVLADDPDAALRVLKRAEEYATAAMKPRILAMRGQIEADASGRKKKPSAGDPPPPRRDPPLRDPPPQGPNGPSSKPPVTDPPPKDPPPVGGGPADPEKAAETAFREARKLMDGGKDAEAIEALLGFLRTHKESKTGAKYENEARNRLQSLAAGPAGIAKLFCGKVEAAEKGRIRISYDFSSPEQAQDFRDENAFEAPPRSTWTVENGTLRAGRGSGAFVLDATFGIENLVVAARVSPERPHDLGVTIVDASESRRFYLYMLQNTFFSLGKGPSAQVFRENAIVLFGPGMWRDTPPGTIGFVRKCGAAEPKAVPGTWVEMRCAKADANVWMKLDGKAQIQGSAYGDIKLEFQGLQPGVFAINSAGVFDDLVIEGTVDPDWAKSRWRTILSGL